MALWLENEKRHCWFILIGTNNAVFDWWNFTIYFSTSPILWHRKNHVARNGQIEHLFSDGGTKEFLGFALVGGAENAVRMAAKEVPAGSDRFHDIHHVLTGYPANWRGEAEIGAWELATGCRTYWVAWFLNLGAAFVGLFLFPRAVVWAFIRGRNSRTNLYHEFEYEPLLDMRIKALRERIGLV